MIWSYVCYTRINGKLYNHNAAQVLALCCWLGVNHRPIGFVKLDLLASSFCVLFINMVTKYFKLACVGWAIDDSPSHWQRFNFTWLPIFVCSTIWLAAAYTFQTDYLFWVYLRNLGHCGVARYQAEMHRDSINRHGRPQWSPPWGYSAVICKDIIQKIVTCISSWQVG